jgi:predicted P-loop ATPase
VRDYFNALPDWDGTARADTFLRVFFKTADTPYTRAVGVRWLISSVARILRPGEQVDHLLVAEGPQGWFKSTGFRMLVKDKGWFTDRLSNINSKDAAMELSGRQIIEIAEMETLLRATSGAKKAFLTRLDDKFRPPYAKRLISLARQCVFCGTVNPVMHEGRFEGYLDDSTGARRFWPVTCLAPVDYKGIAEIRDQLWAEVLFRFKAGEPWHLETPELEALAKAEQDKRYKADKFEAPIREYLDEDNRNDTSIKEILRDVFGHTGKGHHSHEIRIARILTDRLGFERYRSTLKKRPWRYRRVPEHAENIGGENRDKWDGALSQMSQFPGEKSKPTTSTKPITKGRSKKDGTRSRGKTRTKAKDHRRGRSRKRR